MEDCLLTFSHLTSAAAGVVVFVFCITNFKKKILQSVAVCAGEGYVEAMISLVVFFPLPDFTMLTRPPVVCQTIFNKYIFTSFRSLHFFFFFPAHYTYSTKQNNNTSPPKFVFFFFCPLGLFPTEVPDNINTQQFCHGASFREKQLPSIPGQHVVLLPPVYSPFRPGHES